LFLIQHEINVENVKVRIYKTIILPVVLYECETWSLTLRSEHKLRVFQNRELRRVHCTEERCSDGRVEKTA
jgi:hypothetical protein